MFKTQKLNPWNIIRRLFIVSIFICTMGTKIAYGTNGQTTYDIMRDENEGIKAEDRDEEMHDIHNTKGLKKFVKKYPEATTLDLSDKEDIADITCLSRLHDLTTLILTFCNRIDSINPIQYLKKLKELDLTGCTKVTDISPLAGLTKLEKLDLRETNIETLRPLYNLKSLKELILIDCKKLTAEKIGALKKNLPELNIITEE